MRLPPTSLVDCLRFPLRSLIDPLARCLHSQLAHLLNHSEYSEVIRWNREGTAFTFAHGSAELLTVFSRFFRHSNVHSFVRQLNICTINNCHHFAAVTHTTLPCRLLHSAVDDRPSRCARRERSFTQHGILGLFSVSCALYLLGAEQRSPSRSAAHFSSAIRLGTSATSPRSK